MTSVGLLGIMVALAMTIVAIGSGHEDTDTTSTLCLPGASIHIPAARPAPSKRLLHSTVIDAVIRNMSQSLKDKQLAQLFENCFPNTLDTTVIASSFNDSFVITGDIPAMWMRDATNQVLPYVPFLRQDPVLVELFTGLVRRELRSMLISTYADAWNQNASGRCSDPWDEVKPKMSPFLFEEKYELDQLCAVLKITYHTWVELKGGKHDLFGEPSTVDLLLNATEVILATMENQTKSTKEQAGDPPYRFKRAKWPWFHPPVPTIYPRHPVERTGMIRSAFRPSDDETIFDFLLPSNFMVLAELTHLEEMVEALLHGKRIANSTGFGLQERIRALLRDVKGGIDAHGISNRTTTTPAPVPLHRQSHEDDKTDAFPTTTAGSHPRPTPPASTTAPILAYEVDGFGHHNIMDDANVPSLLSLPWLLNEGPGSHYPHQRQLERDTTVGKVHVPLPKEYNATRRWILSEKNPYYFSGRCGEGVGSPHTPLGTVWPMSVMMRAMTSNDDAEILAQLEILKRSANNTGFMHESFHVNNMTDFTRPWFAWANTMFGQVILRLAESHPHLLF